MAERTAQGLLSQCSDGDCAGLLVSACELSEAGITDLLSARSDIAAVASRDSRSAAALQDTPELTPCVASLKEDSERKHYLSGVTLFEVTCVADLRHVLQILRQRGSSAMPTTSAAVHLLLEMAPKLHSASEAERQSSKLTFIQLAPGAADPGSPLESHCAALAGEPACRRDCTLTAFLQDALGGRCRTAVLAAVSASAAYIRSSASTLHFAARARQVINRPGQGERASEVTPGACDRAVPLQECAAPQPVSAPPVATPLQPVVETGCARDGTDWRAADRQVLAAEKAETFGVPAREETMLPEPQNSAAAIVDEGLREGKPQGSEDFAEAEVAAGPTSTSRCAASGTQVHDSGELPCAESLLQSVMSAPVSVRPLVVREAQLPRREPSPGLLQQRDKQLPPPVSTPLPMDASKDCRSELRTIESCPTASPPPAPPLPESWNQHAMRTPGDAGLLPLRLVPARAGMVNQPQQETLHEPSQQIPLQQSQQQQPQLVPQLQQQQQQQHQAQQLQLQSQQPCQQEQQQDLQQLQSYRLPSVAQQPRQQAETPAAVQDVSPITCAGAGSMQSPVFAMSTSAKIDVAVDELRQVRSSIESWMQVLVDAQEALLQARDERSREQKMRCLESTIAQQHDLMHRSGERVKDISDRIADYANSTPQASQHTQQVIKGAGDLGETMRSVKTTLANLSGTSLARSAEQGDSLLLSSAMTCRSDMTSPTIRAHSREPPTPVLDSSPVRCMRRPATDASGLGLRSVPQLSAASSQATAAGAPLGGVDFLRQPRLATASHMVSSSDSLAPYQAALAAAAVADASLAAARAATSGLDLMLPLVRSRPLSPMQNRQAVAVDLEIFRGQQPQRTASGAGRQSSPRQLASPQRFQSVGSDSHPQMLARASSLHRPSGTMPAASSVSMHTASMVTLSAATSRAATPVVSRQMTPREEASTPHTVIMGTPASVRTTSAGRGRSASPMAERCVPHPSVTTANVYATHAQAGSPLPSSADLSSPHPTAFAQPGRSVMPMTPGRDQSIPTPAAQRQLFTPRADSAVATGTSVRCRSVGTTGTMRQAASFTAQPVVSALTPRQYASSATLSHVGPPPMTARGAGGQQGVMVSAASGQVPRLEASGITIVNPATVGSAIHVQGLTGQASRTTLRTRTSSPGVGRWPTLSR
eukprot:TRINITY_DN10293_c0_g3_i3.p1 TRINITY_DN10293_c0_g3~~TRINITY_DN10293_c0_g3_i3.p1  ORF type:complete len:1307 (-),score=195.25 TRINITY_DN10293_c0_g3_i3:75-3566(-)